MLSLYWVQALRKYQFEISMYSMILFRNLLTVMILYIMSSLIPSVRQQFQDYFLVKIESFVQFYTSALLRSAELQDFAPNIEA